VILGVGPIARSQEPRGVASSQVPVPLFRVTTCMAVGPKAQARRGRGRCTRRERSGPDHIRSVF